MDTVIGLGEPFSAMEGSGGSADGQSARLRRSIPLLSIPAYLSEPVSTLMSDDRMPLPAKASCEGKRPIYDWSKWVNSLTNPALWATNDAPMRNLVPSCAEKRLTAVRNNTCGPSEGDTKKELVRLMVHEAGARATGRGSISQLQDQQRNKFRPASSKQMKRETHKLTLIRIVDLAFAFFDLCEAQTCYEAFEQLQDGQNTVQVAIERICTITLSDGPSSVQDIVALVDWMSTTDVMRAGWLRWDLVAADLLQYRLTANLFPPIFPYNLTSSISSFSTQYAVERRVTEWLVNLASNSMSLSVWDGVVRELLSAIPSSSVQADALDTTLRDELSAILSNKLMALLLEPARNCPILNHTDICAIVEYQSHRKEGFLTFRRLVDLVSSLITFHLYLCRSPLFCEKMARESECNDSIVSTSNGGDFEEVQEGIYFDQVLSDIASLMRIVKTKDTRPYASSNASSSFDVALAELAGSLGKMQIFQVADSEKQCLAYQNLLSKARIRANRDVFNCVSHLMPLPSSVDAFYDSGAVETLECGPTSLISGNNFVNEGAGRIERGRDLLCCGLQGQRALCIYGAIHSQYAGRGGFAIQQLSMKIHNSLFPHEELLKADGTDLGIIVDAAESGNLFAHCIYGEILIASNQLSAGARLVVNAARDEEVISRNMLRYETQDDADMNFASLACRCANSSEAAALTGFVILSRLFEEQFCARLAACNGSNVQIDFSNLAPFAVNNETGGCITAESMLQACHILLKSPSSEICHGRAARRIGKACELGIGMNSDGIEAVKYYEQAIRLGVRRAYIDLASLYERGAPGVESNGAKANALYKMCLSHLNFGFGNEDEDEMFVICFSLMANMAYTGAGGMPRDPTAAAMYYRDLFRMAQVEGGDVYRKLTITWYPESSVEQIESTVWINCASTSGPSVYMECLLQAIANGRVEHSHVGYFPMECHVATNQRYRSVDAWFWPWF